MKKSLKMKKKKTNNTRKCRGGAAAAPASANKGTLDKKDDASKNKPDEIGAVFAEAFISILIFLKNKLGKFAGLKPIEEETSSGTPSLVENIAEQGAKTAEQGAKTAINALNTSIQQNPTIKSGVALAAERLVVTLGDVAKVAKEKFDDPEFKQTVLLLVKFIAEMTSKMLDAIKEPLDRSIDKYTDTFEKLLRKLATALANSVMDFMKGIPFLGQGVALIGLMHTITMMMFSFLEAFNKSLNTTANFVSKVTDNLESSGAIDDLVKIKNMLQPSINKYTDIAKSKYEDLKNSSGSTDGISKLKNMLPSINKYTDIAKSKYEDLKTEALKPIRKEVPVNANQNNFSNKTQRKNGTPPSLYPAQIQAYDNPIESPKSEKNSSSSWNPFRKKGGNKMNENQMKAIKGGRKRTQKRIQKTFRDYYNTNKTRRTRR